MPKRGGDLSGRWTTSGGPVEVGVLDPDGPRLLAADVEAVRPEWVSAEKAATAFLAGA